MIMAQRILRVGWRFTTAGVSNLMIYQNITLLAGFVLFYSIFAGRFEVRLINGALMFLLAGLLLGPLALNVLHLSMDAPALRLLLIGLPLCLLAGWGFGVVLFDDMPWLEAAILATMLAPTDAALGKAVVTNPAVPAPIRESLNVESGLNDGICVPVLFILLALLAPEELHQGTLTLALTLITEDIGIGVLVGVALAVGTGILMRYSARHAWSLPLWQQLSMPSLAVLSFSLAQWVGGSGFIAAFVCGLVAGSLLGESKHAYLQSNEGYANLLSVIVWAMFGAVVVANVWQHFTWKTWAYALCSLTLLRMVPVWISFLGTDLSSESRLFVGWFGPRGLASIVFAVIVMQHALIAMPEVIATVACTILLSVVVHGLTANPWIARLQRKNTSDTAQH
jgi:NhaP-type Na+/H+ or K+/H+ antiporter